MLYNNDIAKERKTMETEHEELDEKAIQAVDSVLAQQKITAATYKHILSMNPPAAIIKHHDYGKFDYLPITAVERMLDGLFESWTPKIIREGVAVNGFYMVVTLTAKIPGSDKVLTADGVGFAEFQTKKGAAPTDFSQLMPGAGILAVPRAKAEAIKNAAKSFGNLFGRNLARDDSNAKIELEIIDTSKKKIANTLGAGNEKD